jgi:hypothetical protein
MQNNSEGKTMLTEAQQVQRLPHRNGGSQEGSLQGKNGNYLWPTVFSKDGYIKTHSRPYALLIM